MDWMKFNQEAGVRAGLKMGNGKVITLAMMRSEPFFHPEQIAKHFHTDSTAIITTRMHKMETAIGSATEDMNAANDSFCKASNKLAESADASAAKLKTKASAIKDHAGQLTQAITNFSNAINSEKLARDMANVERLVTALDRLSVLQSDGLLDRVMAAMSPR